jgi:NF-kappa-B inhibitor-like protein 2
MLLYSWVSFLIFQFKCCCFVGDYEDAIVEHEQELVLCESLEDQLGAAVAHRRIGECCSEMGQYDRALCHQRRHLELAQTCGSIIEQQRAHATIGRTHYQRAETCGSGSAEEKNALDDAEQSFKHSLRMCEALKESVSELEYSEMKARLMLNFGKFAYSHSSL